MAGPDTIDAELRNNDDADHFLEDVVVGRESNGLLDLILKKKLTSLLQSMVPSERLVMNRWPR